MANAFIAALALLIYRRIKQDGDTAMAKFRLKPQEAIKDFKILLYAHGFETIVLTVVMIAGIVASKDIVDLGRQLSVAYAIPFTIVFYRWYRRF